MKELVLDISHWDGDIDLNAWKQKRGLWGVIIKVGGNETRLGRYKDSEFERNYEKAKKAGLHIGFYYYTVSTDTENANIDANHMIDLIGNKSYDLPWYMDVEDSRQYALGRRKLTDVIKSFCKTLIAAKKYAGLYVNGSTWLEKVYPEELRDYANWIAWWRSAWPSEAGDIGMWQQGTIRLSDGHIVFDDVSGYVDCDWCVIDYPSRIKNGWIKQQNTEEPKTNQNGSKTEEKKMGKASDVINAAYGELGYCASDDPNPGSKYGRWMAELFNESWLAGPSREVWWCCMFVSWCLNKAGVKVDGFPTYNTDLALKGGAKKYAVDKKSVQYGDIVIFNWDWNGTTDHIGFATGKFDGTGFPTIEGNASTSNAVKEMYRQLGNVAYVLRPPYSDYTNSTGNTLSVTAKPKNNRDGGKLDVDGIGGWNTVIDLQHICGTVEDGWIDGQHTNDKDYHWGMSAIRYGDGGSNLVKALQKKIGIKNNRGYWDSGTSEALQKYLKKLGYKIDIDKYFGRESVKVLQQAINDKKFK